MEKEVVEASLQKQMVTNAYSQLMGSGWSKDIVLSYLRQYVYAELPLLVIEDLQKSFRNAPLLKSMSLEVMEGDIIGLIGPSGCGKTTFLKLLVDFLSPDHGRVAMKVKGKKTYKNLHKNPLLIKTTFGFSTQNPSFYGRLSAFQNLFHFCSLYGYDRKEALRRTEELIHFIGLAKLRDSPAGELSRGLQKKLDIACAIIHDPEILILDEPTADLDPVSRKEVLRLIKSLNQKGKTVIMASHFLEDLQNLCNKLAFIDHGNLTYKASPQELSQLYSKKMQIWVKTMSEDYNKLSLLFRKSYRQNGWFTFLTENPTADLKKIAHRLRQHGDAVTEFKYIHPSLTEIFENLVQENGEHRQAY